MPAQPFIVPGVCRYTIHGTMFSRAVENVLDYEIDTTGSAETRADSCYNMCGVLLNQWKIDILPMLVPQYSFNAVSWVDLDDVDGSTGTRSSSETTTLPQLGTGTAPGHPPNVSLLIRKHITGTRSVRRGRLYLGGTPESYSDSPGSAALTPGTITTVNTKVAAFRTNTNQTDPGIGDYQSHLTVVKILSYYPLVPPNKTKAPATGTHHNVTALTVDPMLATQRRRLRS